MKILKYTLFFILILEQYSCYSIDIQQEALIIAKDSKITKEEFFKLQASIVEDQKYVKYKSSTELYNYLIKFFSAKKLSVDVFNPEIKNSIPFAVNVYFENSYSMDGYISEVDLRRSLYEMLVNFKQISSEINLNYINQKIVRAPSQDIQLYSTGLTPTLFKKMGGNRGDSDIADVIKNVLLVTNNGNMSVLISDFVFSPPPSINAPKYLSIQQTSIRDAIQDKLKKQSLAVSVFRMNAEFSGIYYSYKNPKGFNISSMRPYYIWLIGTSEQIQKANKAGIVSDTDDKLLNSLTFTSTKNLKIPSYKITTNAKGEFRPKSIHHISNAKAIQGEFSFNVAADFSGHIQGLSYFDNKSIYKLNSPNYTLSVRRVNAKEKNMIAFASSTHIITLTTKKLQTEKLAIKVLSKVPEWIAVSSSIDDQHIKTNKSEQAKTFGLNNLITGLWQGFSSSANENVITELKLNIEK